MLRNIPKKRGFYTIDSYWKIVTFDFWIKIEASGISGEVLQVFAESTATCADPPGNTLLLVCEKVLC